MNQYEVSKLRKQLQRNQDVIEQLRSDLQFTEKKLAQVQAERDRYHSEILLMRESIQNVDGAISNKIQQIKLQQRKNFAFKLQQHQKLKNDFDLEKTLRDKLESEIKLKDATISELTLKLRQMARKHGDSSAIVNAANIKQNIALNAAQFLKLTQKYNKLASDTQNVIAENRILRKLHGVPDNFGFDLEQIKVAQKQELEDYKTQVKHLEAELEQLQSERTQLRYRLRQYSSLYSNKGERYKDFTPQQFELLDAYALNLKQGRIELPQIDKSKKQMEKEIIKLRAQLQMFHGKLPQGGGNPEDVKRYHNEVKGLLSPVLDSIQKALAQGPNVSNYTNNIHNISNINQMKPPMPLPAPINDWQNIQQGMSFTLNSKIPLQLKQLYGQTGFNIAQAKYEVGVLQLHNIENMKIIREKQRIQKQLLRQLEYLKEQYKKFILLEDDVLIKHFLLKDQMNSKLSLIKAEKSDVLMQRDQFRKKFQILEDSYQTILNKSPSQLEAKVIDLTKRLAISEGQTLKMQRKYKIISQQQTMLRKNYSQLQQKSSDIESGLRQKLLIVKINQDLLSQTLNTVLDDCKDNVSIQTHTIVRNKLEIVQDKYANLLIKQGDLRKRIATLEGADRTSHLKQKTIDTLREDNSDLILELEIIKCRLISFDSQYKSYTELFEKFIKFIITNNISPLTFFKKFDKSGDGLLQKQQLKSGISALGFNINGEQFNLLYSFIDIDGSGSINYKQFLKKLRRSGVQMKTQQQIGITKLHKAITDKNFTLKQAFQAIDTNSSNSISKGQMQQAMLRIGIPITSDTVDYIFRMVDDNMDGNITYNEFEKIFVNIIGQTQIEEKAIFNTTLDWKYGILLKMDEAASKNNMSIIQAFEILDNDKSRSITIKQLKQFFRKTNIEMSNSHLTDFFRMLDKNGSKTVDYDQFLELIKQAKKQKQRIQRIQYVKKRQQQIKREHGIQSAQFQYRVNEQSTLRGKLMALQLKQNHFAKKHQMLMKQLTRREADIKDLKDTLDQNQKSIFNVQRDFYIQKQKNITLQQKSKGALSVKQVDRLKGRYNHQHIQNSQLRTQLELYKGLSQIFNGKTKQYQRNLHRIEEEKEKFYDLVKQFQSGSDINALVGKLTVELQQLKYEKQAYDQRYEKVINDTKITKSDNVKLLKDIEAKDKQIVNTHLYFRQQSSVQQKSIDELSGKILPTITLPRVEGLAIKLRQLSVGRSELEGENRKLRQDNFDLQLRNDYLQGQRANIEDLQIKLRRLYAGDENAITIIDLSKKLSQYKMIELKAKRQSALLKQKQDYYTRINHTNQDVIKQLQEELSKWETKFTLSEDNWRKKLSEQAKLAEAFQLQNAKNNDTSNNFFDKRNQQNQADRSLQNRLIHIGSQDQYKNIRSSQINQSPSLQRRLIDVQRQNDDLRQKLKQILSVSKNIPHMVDYSVQGSQIYSQSINMQTDLTVSQLKNNANRFIKTAQNRQQFFSQQSSKLAQAAQQSILTLQGIIDDKNQQIKRKDKLIQDLKQDFLRTKQYDTQTIQKLNERLANTNENGDSSGYVDTFMRQTRVRKPTDVKFNELIRQLQVKDRRIRQLQYGSQSHMVKSNKYKNDDELKRLQNKIIDLEHQKQQDQKAFNAIESDLKRRINGLQKLSKQKDLKLARLQKSLAQIKSDIIGQKQIQQRVSQIQKLKINTNNANNSQLETLLQKAHETMKKQITQINDLSDKLKVQSDINIALKQKMIPKTGATGTAQKRGNSVRK